jgi:hypothetical protein
MLQVSTRPANVSLCENALAHQLRSSRLSRPATSTWYISQQTISDLVKKWGSTLAVRTSSTSYHRWRDWWRRRTTTVKLHAWHTAARVNTDTRSQVESSAQIQRNKTKTYNCSPAFYASCQAKLTSTGPWTTKNLV